MATESNQTTLTIRILGRDYSVACPDGERDSLLKSAEHLSARMQAIQRRGKTLGMDRIAVMAALNIARDLIDLQDQETPRRIPGNTVSGQEQAAVSDIDEALEDRLSNLQRRIDSALDDPS